MIIAGEKINGTILSVAKAIAQKDSDFIKDLAKTQADAGADFIDVCASTDVSIELETMKWLIDLVQEAVDTPIAIDSPDANICAKSVAFCNKPGLINSVSMEGDKVDVVFPVIAISCHSCYRRGQQHLVQSACPKICKSGFSCSGHGRRNG